MTGVQTCALPICFPVTIGMGSTIADSALSQDAPVVLGLSVVVIAFGALINLIVDLSYALIDPRIKIEGKAVTS